MSQAQHERPIQDYPTRWLYKVIGRGERVVRAAIEEVMTGKQFDTELSNTSSQQTYCCINVELTVHTEAERDTLYRSLKSHLDVILVL